MPIPDFQICMLPLLQYAADWQPHRLKDAVNALADRFNLSHDERSQMLPSESRTVFEDRVSWARFYLKQAGILDYPERGMFRITEEGNRVLGSGIDHVDRNFLKQYPSFQAFLARTKTTEGQMTDSFNLDELEELLLDFAKVADVWFAQRPFVINYWKFMESFFKPENLKTVEWPDIQKLGDHIHSLQTNALAKARAFGKPNYPIQQYRESFSKLAHGEGDIEERMRWFLTDDSTTNKYLGASSVGEILGQLNADTHVIYNKRDEEAVRYLGIEPNFSRGDDDARRFIKFNQAIQPVFQSYRENVGSKIAVPIGLEVDQFLCWLYETKELGKSVIKEIKTEQKVWEYAPGPNAIYWEAFHSEGIAALGWNNIKDLRKFKTREEIVDDIKGKTNSDIEPRNDSLALWQWLKEVKPGDIIIAKQGRRAIVGVGVVDGDYEYRTERNEYRHVRKVRWEKQGIWTLPPGLNLTVKTLTNLTTYPEHVAKLMALINAADLPPQVRHYWWINCNPSKWDVAKASIGHRESFQSIDDEGNKREVYKYFEKIQMDDEILAYMTSPIRQVTTLLRATKALGEDAGFECEVVKQFEIQPQWEDLKKEDRLAECEPLLKGSGALFSLTEDEYAAIIEMSEDVKGDIDIKTFTIEDATESLFMDVTEFQKILDLLKNKRNLILQGSPGVGKTFIARRIAYALIGEKNPTRVQMVQFHQSYSYEDFVQGYRPDGSGFSLKNGIFYQFCEKARKDDRPYVFIIDEINRGNLSKIFGELMMLVEKDKRVQQYAIPLVYQREGEPDFYVPINVHIIGLMNTADRSLAMVDYALRRRFSFVDLVPAFGSAKYNQRLAEICGDGLSQRITEAFQELNRKIAADTDNLGPGFCIGHSYFCVEKTDLLDGPKYRRIIETEIAPLLREYWFDQPKMAQDQIEKLMVIAG